MYFRPPSLTYRSGQGRSLWLHAGLHKTGTTSLQAFLKHERERLNAHGIRPIRAGTSQRLDGHHNLAWELTGDARRDLDAGTLDEAIEEIAGFDGDAILSSEDFESLLHRPGKFAPLLADPRLRGWRVNVVVYVRNQAESLASLLAELPKHGLTPGDKGWLEGLLRHGRWPVRDWVFQFDVAALRRSWPYRGVPLVLRNYHQLSRDSVIDDFMALAAPGFCWAGEPPRLNTARQKVRLSDHTTARVMARFADGNRKSCAAAGLPATGLLTAPAWTADADVLG